MTFDLQRMLDGKRVYRERLAALPIGDRLRMLDVMRERELIIRLHARPRSKADAAASVDPGDHILPE